MEYPKWPIPGTDTATNTVGFIPVSWWRENGYQLIPLLEFDGEVKQGMVLAYRYMSNNPRRRPVLISGEEAYKPFVTDRDILKTDGKTLAWYHGYCVVVEGTTK